MDRDLPPTRVLVVCREPVVALGLAMLAVDQPDLEVGRAVDWNHQRHEPAGREVDVPNARVGFVQDHGTKG